VAIQNAKNFKLNSHVKTKTLIVFILPIFLIPLDCFVVSLLAMTEGEMSLRNKLPLFKLRTTFKPPPPRHREQTRLPPSLRATGGSAANPSFCFACKSDFE
jgi:hypothetical protein